MRTSAIVLSLLRVALVGGGLSACGGAQGKLSVDTPLLPYQKPDISEITHIDDDDASDASGSGAEAGKK
jgi:hypothetical protein